MPKVSLYNATGSVVGELELSGTIFDVTPDPAVIHEAVVAQQSNARQVVAHTKTKGEVRGGGKKPWKQKGTGRARQGSIRAPQWKGGGVVFGPRNTRNFAKKINAKMKRKALCMTLTDKVQAGTFVVLDALQFSEIKTKQAIQLLTKLPVRGKSVLVALPAKNEVITKSFRNIPKTDIVLANSLNVVDVVGHQIVVTDKAGVELITATYQK